MKKYLVWKAGSAPTSGVVVKAESSFEARTSVAHRRNADSVANGLGLIFSADEFCARLVPDADEVGTGWNKSALTAAILAGSRPSGSRLTQADADRLELLARRFAQLAAEKAFAGTQHPEDAAAIRAEYKEKSRALAAAFRELVR